MKEKKEMDLEKVSGSAFICHSDSGNDYRITVVEGIAACSCQGFRFTRKCKHIEFFTQNTGQKVRVKVERTTEPIKKLLAIEERHMELTEQFLQEVGA